MEKNHPKTSLRWCSSMLLSTLLLAACGGGSGGGSTPVPSVQYALQTSVSGSGALSSQPAGIDCGSTCSANFGAGSTVTLTATPASGQQFAAWGGACTGSNTVCTVTMDQAQTVSARFDALGTSLLELGITLLGSGTVASQPAGIQCGSVCTATFPANSTLTLTATPGTGQVFTGWNGACSGSAANCTVTLASAGTATATFAAAPVAGWGGEIIVEANDGSSSTPVLAMDSSGRTTAVWTQRHSTTGVLALWSSRSTADGVWSSPEQIANDLYVGGIRLAVDRDSGRGILSWIQTGGAGTTFDLWARPLDPSSGWGPVALVDNANGLIESHSVGMDTNGNALAVWAQREFAQYRVFANRFTPAAGWGTATQLEPTDTVGSLGPNPIVAVAPSGSAVAVWKRGHLRSSLYNPSSGWGSATEAVSDSGSNQAFGVHDLAVDANGGGLLVWGQIDQVSPGAWESALWFKRFTANAWQSTASRVAPPLNTTLFATPRLRMNAAGASVVSWEQPDNAMVVAVASPGAAFGSVSTLRSAAISAVSTPGLPGLGIDDAQAAFATWSSHTGSNIMASRLTPGASWSEAATQESYEYEASFPNLVVNERGHAVLAWVQSLDRFGGNARLIVRRWNSGR